MVLEGVVPKSIYSVYMHISWLFDGLDPCGALWETMACRLNSQMWMWCLSGRKSNYLK